jgi:hypothetical protein
MADVTAAYVGANKVLATMGLTTNPKEYLVTGGGKANRVVTFYCDVAWKYSNLTGGVYRDVPASPAGQEIVLEAGSTSVWAKVGADTGTLTPVTSRKF